MREKREEMVSDLSEDLMRMLRAIRHDVKELFTGYVPWNEYVILYKLCQHSPQKPSDLAHATEVATSHITAVIDKLSRRGLVKRRHSEEDRRMVFIEITDEGHQMAAELDELQRNYYLGKFSNLSNEEIQSMREIISKIVDGSSRDA